MSIKGNLCVDLQGESLVLLPERALLWERTGTLIVADAHLGKAAAFRAAAIPMPGGTTTEALSRLTAALGRTGARRLLLLGDFFHAKSGRAAPTLAAISSWRDRHADLEIVLVRGNHDLGAGDPPPEWRFDCCDEPCIEPPFAFRHHPAEEPGGYVLAGHIHPAVSLSGPGRQRERFPCFLFGEKVGLLPAFGGFTGGASVRPKRGDRVFVLAGEDVVPIDTMG
ncbi:MAG TPA: ligase-associated DNA damage response endonuclease PdeM [Thermoanaerobaculia bacterium]|nr:ligase-associated DNA damage response endonuclease PdeM [Thermoanaerobaculia bacterium]